MSRCLSYIEAIISKLFNELDLAGLYFDNAIKLHYNNFKDHTVDNKQVRRVGSFNDLDLMNERLLSGTDITLYSYAGIQV
ncbi:MAG: hypothetical protein OEX11_00850 [Nitrosomonas sp.]|nr:hypothetical protein [Nitrosomonas sp.]